MLIFSIGSTFGQNVVLHVSMPDRISKPDSDTIYYQKTRSLDWGDFQGKPFVNHPGVAVTASGFAYDWQAENDGNVITIDLVISVYFSKSASWKRDPLVTAGHLRHEQIHFDITRIGAERLKQRLKSTTLSKDTYQQQIQRIYDDVYKENIALQRQYDQETGNSVNAEKQAEWAAKIKRQIERLP